MGSLKFLFSFLTSILFFFHKLIVLIGGLSGQVLCFVGIDRKAVLQVTFQGKLSLRSSRYNYNLFEEAVRFITQQMTFSFLCWTIWFTDVCKVD